MAQRDVASGLFGRVSAPTSWRQYRPPSLWRGHRAGRRAIRRCVAACGRTTAGCSATVLSHISIIASLGIQARQSTQHLPIPRRPDRLGGCQGPGDIADCTHCNIVAWMPPGAEHTRSALLSYTPKHVGLYAGINTSMGRRIGVAAPPHRFLQSGRDPISMAEAGAASKATTGSLLDSLMAVVATADGRLPLSPSWLGQHGGRGGLCDRPGGLGT